MIWTLLKANKRVKELEADVAYVDKELAKMAVKINGFWADDVAKSKQIEYLVEKLAKAQNALAERDWYKANR